MRRRIKGKIHQNSVTNGASVRNRVNHHGNFVSQTNSRTNFLVEFSSDDKPLPMATTSALRLAWNFGLVRNRPLASPRPPPTPGKVLRGNRVPYDSGVATRMSRRCWPSRHSPPNRPAHFLELATRDCVNFCTKRMYLCPFELIRASFFSVKKVARTWITSIQRSCGEPIFATTSSPLKFWNGIFAGLEPESNSQVWIYAFFRFIRI